MKQMTDVSVSRKVNDDFKDTFCGELPEGFIVIAREYHIPYGQE